MIASFRHRRISSLFAWFALAAVLFRALVPAGYMPVHADSSGPGLQLAVCHGGALITSDAAGAGHHVSQSECPFALSAMAAIPPTGFAPSLAADVTVAAVDDQSPSVVVSPARLRPPARAPPLFS
jgi:hypothetical protein